MPYVACERSQGKSLSRLHFRIQLLCHIVGYFILLYPTNNTTMTGRPQPPEPPQHGHGQNGKVGQIRAPVNHTLVSDYAAIMVRTIRFCFVFFLRSRHCSMEMDENIEKCQSRNVKEREKNKPGTGPLSGFTS